MTRQHVGLHRRGRGELAGYGLVPDPKGCRQGQVSLWSKRDNDAGTDGQVGHDHAAGAPSGRPVRWS
jgi:hypothetical protein